MYQDIVDSSLVRETNATKVGKHIILPPSFIGGPKNMWKIYMEAIVLVQWFGKHDIFLMITCNPTWKKILDELRPHGKAQNRFDLVAHIF